MLVIKRTQIRISKFLYQTNIYFTAINFHASLYLQLLFKSHFSLAEEFKNNKLQTLPFLVIYINYITSPIDVFKTIRNKNSHKQLLYHNFFADYHL